MKRFRDILLVDDDHVACFLNKLLINDMELAEHIHVAENGQLALEFLRDQEHKDATQPNYPELIILDVNMPVMNGFEFLEQFNKTEKHQELPTIIMLTSSLDPRDIERANRHRVQAFINKPLTEEKIMEALQQSTRKSF